MSPHISIYISGALCKIFYYFKQINVGNSVCFNIEFVSSTLRFRNICLARSETIFMLMNKLDIFLRSVCLFLKFASCLLNSTVRRTCSRRLTMAQSYFKRQRSCLVVLLSYNGMIRVIEDFPSYLPYCNVYKRVKRTQMQPISFADVFSP